MKYKFFKNAVIWSEETTNNIGLPRPVINSSFGNKEQIKRAKIAKIVPIPWQSKPGFGTGGFLQLNLENENQVYINNLCPYCGIKIKDSENTARWKTADLEKSTENGDRVFSDFHPFHLECMKQGRTFCPFIRDLNDEDFEYGSFFELRKNADIDKEKAVKNNGR